MSKFDRKLRITRFGRLSPIHVGIGPVSRLKLRSRVTNSTRFFKDGWIVPVRLLLLKCNITSEGNVQTEPGSPPVKLLFVKFKPSRKFKDLFQQFGSSPERWLLETSR